VNPLAHGVGSSEDLPLPLDLVLQAGAATVVLSFLISALWWRTPRLKPSSPRSFGVSRWFRYPVLALTLAITGYAIVGPRTAENPAAHALFVWLWVGLVLVSVVFGPVWRTVNPLRTMFTLLGLPRRGLRPLPPGHARSSWPAAAFLLAFVWFELVVPHHGDPVTVGLFLLLYAVSQLALAILRGEEWFTRGDCFEVYSDLAGRLSPLHWPRPLSGLVPSDSLLASHHSTPAPSDSGRAPGVSALVPGDSGRVPGDPALVPGDAALVPGGSGLAPGDAALVPGGSGLAPGDAALVPGGSGLAPGDAALVSDASGLAPGEPELASGNSGLVSADAGLGLGDSRPDSAGIPGDPAPVGPASAARTALTSTAKPHAPSTGESATPRRAPLSTAGLGAFIAVWWGSTVFDSASASPWWSGLVERAGSPLLWGTAGLALLCTMVFLAVRWTAGRLDVTMSLIPIAAGYTLAHYLSLLLVEGPRGVLLLFGASPDLWNPALAPEAIAAAQIVLILAGHVIGVIVAHDHALVTSLSADPGRPLLAVVADELPMVLFMIGCTWAGLFLLFVR